MAKKSKHFPSPPPVIASDRLLHYAILDNSVGYTAGHGLLFVDGEEIGKVPCLAICQSRNKSEVVLYFCEKDWNSIAVSVHDSVANAKRRAERIYPRSSALWKEAHISEQEVARHLDNLYKDFRCSFCGKRGDLVGQMFAGNGTAQICDECVAEFHAGLGNLPPQTD
jgi:hypothetical protein